MPAKRAAPVVKGKSLKSSSVAVAERTTSGAVPPVAVKIFWADVARLVPVATPKTGVVKVGEVANTKAPVPISSVTRPARTPDAKVFKSSAGSSLFLVMT